MVNNNRLLSIITEGGVFSFKNTGKFFSGIDYSHALESFNLLFSTFLFNNIYLKSLIFNKTGTKNLFFMNENISGNNFCFLGSGKNLKVTNTIELQIFFVELKDRQNFKSSMPDGKIFNDNYDKFLSFIEEDESSIALESIPNLNSDDLIKNEPIIYSFAIFSQLIKEKILLVGKEEFYVIFNINNYEKKLMLSLHVCNIFEQFSNSELANSLIKKIYENDSTVDYAKKEFLEDFDDFFKKFKYKNIVNNYVFFKIYLDKFLELKPSFDIESIGLKELFGELKKPGNMLDATVILDLVNKTNSFHAEYSRNSLKDLNISELKKLSNMINKIDLSNHDKLFLTLAKINTLLTYLINSEDNDEPKNNLKKVEIFHDLVEFLPNFMEIPLNSPNDKDNILSQLNLLKGFYTKVKVIKENNLPESKNFNSKINEVFDKIGLFDETIKVIESTIKLLNEYGLNE